MGRARGLGGFRVLALELMHMLIKKRTTRFETIQMKKRKAHSERLGCAVLGVLAMMSLIHQMVRDSQLLLFPGA